MSAAADDPGPLDWLLSASGLAAARADVVEGELVSLLDWAGAPADADRRALGLADETLAALILLVAADPRVAQVRVAPTPEGYGFLERFNRMRKEIGA